MSNLELGFIRLADGLRLRYRSMEADGPTVLLLHGWPQSGHAWRRVMPSLAASGYFPLVPDLRGCGDSDKPTGGYDAADAHGGHARPGRRPGGGGRPDLPGRPRRRGGGGRQRLRRRAPRRGRRAWPSSAPRPAGRSAQARPRATGTSDFHHTPDLPELLLEGHVDAYLRHFFRAWSHDPDMLHETRPRRLRPRPVRAGRPARQPRPVPRPAHRPPVGVSGQVPLLLLVGESDPRLDRTRSKPSWRSTAGRRHPDHPARRLLAARGAPRPRRRRPADVLRQRPGGLGRQAPRAGDDGDVGGGAL